MCTVFILKVKRLAQRPNVSNCLPTVVPKENFLNMVQTIRKWSRSQNPIISCLI